MYNFLYRPTSIFTYIICFLAIAQRSFCLKQCKQKLHNNIYQTYNTQVITEDLQGTAYFCSSYKIHVVFQLDFGYFFKELKTQHRGTICFSKTFEFFLCFPYDRLNRLPVLLANMNRYHIISSCQHVRFENPICERRPKWDKFLVLGLYDSYSISI